MTSPATAHSLFPVPDRKYRNPPVVEALCEMYFSDSKWDVTTPGLFLNEIKDEYPEVKELQQMEAQVRVAPETQNPQFKRGGTRTQFLQKHKSRLVQLERDLLVINQLKPYPRFNDWKPTIISMFERYLKIAQPRGVSKLGVRYINKIILPPVPLKMQHYFKIYPEIPKELGETHGRFMLRFDAQPRHSLHQLVVTFGLESLKEKEPVDFLFDLYNISPLPGDCSVEALIGVLDEAHENIVLFFENSLTPKTKEIFDQD